MPRLAVVVLLLCGGVAHAQPTGAHPRLILTQDLIDTWAEQAKDSDSSVAHAIDHCDEIRGDPDDHKRDLYMGLDWSLNLQSCLIAWAATGKDGYAQTAMVYFKANLDDLEVVGDGKGGDKAARRDSGFAMRAMGPSTALAYDWLHGHKEMTEKLREKARKRFKAWTDWYETDGYRARSPHSNYHAGWLLAATFIAIAEGGEAGDEGDELWNLVKDQLWGQDMAKALEPGGTLEGGDWAEGWQYAPLAVASYALASREMARQGVKIEGIGRWLEGVLKHNVYARAPGGGVFVNGDSQGETPNLPVRGLSYATPLIGDATAEVHAWAKAEMAAVGAREDEFPMFGAVAEARDVEPVKIPRDTWPTSYLAAGTGTFYTRTHWGKDAIWMVLSCTKTVDTDHFHPDAGNVVLSRGADDVIVDPSPYGTLSTLTSNAPTVRSAQLPEEYLPSQAFWSKKTRYVWARQTKGGVVAARCDYADQYAIFEEKSDVPAAERDLVLLPSADGTSATLVVIDRAETGDKKREMNLRFRTPGKLTLDGDVATGKVGSTALAIRKVRATGGKLETRRFTRGSCYDEGHTRGGCDAARFAVDEARLIVPGPEMEAIHVLDVGPSGSKVPDAVPLTGADGLVLTRGDRVNVVVLAGGKDASYTAPAGTHVVLDATAQKDGRAVVSATAAKDGCTVKVAASGDGALIDARPLVITLDSACAITEDVAIVAPALGGGDGGGGDGDGGVQVGGGDDGGNGSGAGGVRVGPRNPRTGCCGASASPGSAIAMSLVVLLALATLRRRP